MRTDPESVFAELRTEFTVTEDHLKLLRRGYVAWDDIEFGAPGLDGKRPYGKSDVVGDIAEILGRPGADSYPDEEFPDHVEDDLTRLHAEVGVALQIALVTGAFTAGRYVKTERWTIDWTPAK